MAKLTFFLNQSPPYTSNSSSVSLNSACISLKYLFLLLVISAESSASCLLSLRTSVRLTSPNSSSGSFIDISSFTNSSIFPRRQALPLRCFSFLNREIWLFTNFGNLSWRKPVPRRSFQPQACYICSKACGSGLYPQSRLVHQFDQSGYNLPLGNLVSRTDGQRQKDASIL